MRYLQEIKEEKKIKLDVKDKKILSLLAQNARTPHTLIAKGVGLSRDAVSYRIKNLENRGVIQGYRTVVDISKFGYDAYHIFLQLSQPSKEAERLLIKKFKDYPFIRAAIKFSGKYDFQLATIAKNIENFDSILSKVINGCSNYLQEYEILIVSNNYISNVFPKSFLKIKEKNLPKKIDNAKIDDKDKEILKVIANNADMLLYRIASKVKLSADTVNYRIKNMVKEGVILGFIPVINYAALSYSIYAVLLNIQGLTDIKEAKLKQVLKVDENILWAVKTIGRYNIMAYVCTRNSEDLHETLIKLRRYFPEEIRNYETLIAYEEYKYTYFPDYSYI